MPGRCWSCSHSPRTCCGILWSLPWCRVKVRATQGMRAHAHTQKGFPDCGALTTSAVGAAHGSDGVAVVKPVPKKGGWFICPQTWLSQASPGCLLPGEMEMTVTATEAGEETARACACVLCVYDCVCVCVCACVQLGWGKGGEGAR